MRSRHLLASFALATSLVLAAPALAAPGSESRTTASPEQAARDAFAALQSGDASRYDALVPSVERLSELMTTYLAGLPTKQREAATQKMARKGGLPKVLAEAHAKALKRFARAHDEGAQAFDWNDAQFVAVDRSRFQGRSQGVIKTAQIRFFVRSHDTLHEFGANDALLLDNQWSFVEGLSYGGAVGARAPREVNEVKPEKGALELRISELQASLLYLRRELDKAQRLQPQPRSNDTARAKAQRKALGDHIDKLERVMREQADRHATELDRATNAAADANTRDETKSRDLRRKFERIQIDLDGTRWKLKRAQAATEEAVKHARLSEWLLKNVTDAVRGLEPVIISALTHESEPVRKSAESAAIEGLLKGARPHFTTVAKDKRADTSRRIRAVKFLVTTGDAREQAALLTAIWNEDLPKSLAADDAEEADDLEGDLRYLLQLAGVDADKLTRAK